MMQPVEPTHMIVDLRDYSEIKNVESADLDTNQISIREMTYEGELLRTLHVPTGIRRVKRGR